MNYSENVEEYNPNEGNENEIPTEHTHNMAAIRIPKKYLEFLNRNPKLGQVVGSLVIARTEIKERLDILNKILLDGDVFEGKLEDGTKEELNEFLAALAEQTGSATIFKNMTNEQFEEVKQKLNEAELASTMTNLNTGVSETLGVQY